MNYRLPISSHIRNINVIQNNNTYIFKIPLYHEQNLCRDTRPKIFIQDYDMVLSFIKKNTEKDIELYEIIKKIQ